MCDMLVIIYGDGRRDCVQALTIEQQFDVVGKRAQARKNSLNTKRLVEQKDQEMFCA